MEQIKIRNPEVNGLLVEIFKNLKDICTLIDIDCYVFFGTVKQINKHFEILTNLVYNGKVADLEEVKFLLKLIKVYKKYGIMMFKDSIISHLCLYYIYKYLAPHYDEIEKKFNTFIKEFIMENMTSEDQLMTIDELIEGDSILCNRLENPYVQIVASKETLISYLVDAKGKLYKFGDVEISAKTSNIVLKQIAENVRLIEINGPQMCGIDLDGRLWSADVTKQELIKIYVKMDDEEFVKLAVMNNSFLFALTKSGRMFMFEILKTLVIHDELQETFVDVSACEDYAMLSDKKGNVYLIGEENKIGIIYNISTSSHLKPIVNDTLIKVGKVYAFKHIAYIVDVYGKVFFKVNDSTGFQMEQIPGKVANISEGQGHVVFLTDKGECYGCGSNLSYELGKLEKDVSIPTKFTDEKAVMLVAGRFCTFIVNQYYDVIGMGYNRDGRMGVETDKEIINITINKLNWLDMWYKI